MKNKNNREKRQRKLQNPKERMESERKVEKQKEALNDGTLILK
jgi:hypothetical protein